MEKKNYEEVMEIVKRVKMCVDSWTQFRHCQAWFSNPVGNYQLLMSYKTIVALVDMDNQVVYRLGKWSTTTSKQTTQFSNQFYPRYEQVQF
jgi:hypothetical protein